MTKPFRFAITVGDAADRASLLETIRRAEDTGFAVLAGVDHIGPPLGVLPMLAAAAQLTTLRLSPMVIANDYRHPVQLARDTATIDVLSGGRFELGLGTGWIKAQYAGAGIPYDAAGTRVARLEEAVAVIKGCWTNEPFAYSGEHYQVDLVGSPRPLQEPRPPLLIAGSGPRMLRLAGREADIVSITVTRGMSGFDDFPAALAGASRHIEHQLDAIRAGAGEQFEQRELSVMIHHHLAGISEAATLAERTGTLRAEVEDSPHLLIGGTEQMAETLLERRERFGISYVVIRGAHFELMAPVVKRLAAA